MLLVDDQQLLRRGLAMLLSTADGIDVVGQAADGTEALAVLGRERDGVDVLLTDARMPGMDGVELTAACRERWPDLPVLTRTERLVAELVADGRTNAEIASVLVLAEGTVKNHVSSLLRKLDQRDRTGLALALYKTMRG